MRVNGTDARNTACRHVAQTTCCVSSCLACVASCLVHVIIPCVVRMRWCCDAHMIRTCPPQFHGCRPRSHQTSHPSLRQCMEQHDINIHSIIRISNHIQYTHTRTDNTTGTHATEKFHIQNHGYVCVCVCVCVCLCACVCVCV